MRSMSRSATRAFRSTAMTPPFTVIIAGRFAVLLALGVVWTAAAERVGPVYLPDPAVVLERLVDGLRSGSMIRATVATVRLAGAGLLLGVGLGVVTVLTLSLAPRALAALERYVVASAAVPKYALTPLLILWLGIGDAPKLALIGLLVFYPVFVSGLAGLRAVDRQLVAMIRVLGADRFHAIRHVVWYSTLPFAFAALRVALPRAVSGAIVSELLVGGDGIGFLIESARQRFDTPGLFAAVALAAILAALGTSGLVPLERWLMPWRPNPSYPSL
jgi:NitT/TauT family transport system permease protein